MPSKHIILTLLEGCTSNRENKDLDGVLISKRHFRHAIVFSTQNSSNRRYLQSFFFTVRANVCPRLDLPSIMDLRQQADRRIHVYC